jgi:hypothetical protein
MTTIRAALALILVHCFTVVRLVRGHACEPGRGDCIVDGNVGSSILYEDARARVWNFTLAPNESTSMHRHDCDYHFVALEPSTLEVWGANGDRLFDFVATGTLGFKIEGDFLLQIAPTGVDMASFTPIRVPRVHSARNIGDATYREILFESCKVDRARHGDEL